MCYNWQTVAVVSAETGITLWKTTISQDQGIGHPLITISDKYVYHTVRSTDKKKCYIRRSPLTHAAWDTVATWGMETYTNKWGITSDYPPDLEPPTEYVAPGTTDTLLLFYNRTGISSGGGGWWDYMALHCINAATGGIVWSRPMIDPSGGAGGSIYAYNEKLYITTHNVMCLNPTSGLTLWEYTRIGNEGIQEGFTGSGLAFSDGKIAFAPGNDRLHCISAETGQRLWINDTAGQSFVIHACNGRIGYNWRIFDLSTGKLLVPNDYIQGSSLTIDCENNRVFTQGQDNGKNYLFGYQMLK
jgi:outer membrane protein assembly factor BamB